MDKDTKIRQMDSKRIKEDRKRIHSVGEYVENVFQQRAANLEFMGYRAFVVQGGE